MYKNIIPNVTSRREVPDNFERPASSFTKASGIQENTPIFVAMILKRGT
jgi:hypothetical protein